jgi:hypothetical protein
MNSPLTGIFSPATRKALYVLFSLAAVVVGAVMAYCGATDAVQPDWVDGANAVLTYVGAALGLTAASNIPTPDTDEPGGDPESGEVGIVGVLLVVLVVAVVIALLR